MKKTLAILALSTAIMLAAVLLLSAAPPPAVKNADSAMEAARLNNLGVAYMNQQAFDRGLASFQKAAAADPTFAVARLNVAIALLNLQKLEEARPTLLALAQSTPQDPHIWYNLGLMYKNSGQLDEAAAAFRKVIAIDANDADTYYFLGSVESQRKRYPEAIESFQKAVIANRFHVSSEFGMSRAYQQSGDIASSRLHLARFQQITRDKLGSAITLAYGEQGQYSRAEESPMAVSRVPAAIPVKFVAVENAGLSASPPIDEHALPQNDWGACVLDLDGDGLMDLLVTDGRGVALYRNHGGTFADVTMAAGLDMVGSASSCAVGDFDNDGATDLALSTSHGVILLHNEKNGKFKDVTEVAGIGVPGAVSSMTFVDYDHDGDLDLFVNGPHGNVMLRNNGNSTFTDVTADIGLAGDGPTRQMIATDFNNDRAIDLVVTGDQTAIFANPREGKFRVMMPWATPMPAATVGVAALDFDHDGWMDLVFTHSGAPGLTLWRNVEGRSFDPVKLPELNWVKATSVAALDYDNDGWVDLVARGVTKDGHPEMRLLRNLGPDGFKDVTSDVGLDKFGGGNIPAAIVVADFDNDGASDILVEGQPSRPILLRNDGGNKNHSLRLSFKGLNDNRNGFGTKVEVFAGGITQKFELAGSSGYRGQSSPVLTVGIGQNTQADIVRMLWPSGVLQDELEAKADVPSTYTEIDRRGSSCPTLFAWNGERFELVGDLLGAGVLGHWVAPGERNIARPEEYIKIEPGQAKVENGRLLFSLMEPMEEVVYLDQVKVVAVDHPRGINVYPDERFLANPPYPAFKVLRSQAARPPVGAWDDKGDDLLPSLLAHQYVEGFDLLPFKGFAKMHSLELDLGDRYQSGPLRLLMHGEIEYFTATGLYAADQAGVKAVSPFVEAQDAAGHWTRVVEDMGFPAGLPRTMVADLSGKLPPGTKRIRITTNLQIYWDSILIDRTADNAIPVNLTDLAPAKAELRFHGYPRQIEGKPSGNVHYRYEQISNTGPYARQPGTYTRYGNVQPLLASGDDHFAVFGSGEEVALEFDVSHLAPPAQGMVRDYFFMAAGYEKDMDFYAAEGSTVEPLPFRNMPGYPYSGTTHFPLDDEHLNYLLEFNTRQVSGNEPRGYWYEYGRAKHP